MPALGDWTGEDRWKVTPGSIDFSQITVGDMADDDRLTITEVMGVMHQLMRKLAGTTTSSPWGTTCVNLPAPSTHIVTFIHGSPFYLVYHQGTPGVEKNWIECWKGRYTPKTTGGPTGAVWTAEDQT